MNENRILLVQDDPQNTDCIAAILKSEALQLVAVAMDAQQTRTMSREHLPDVVMVDTSLPEFDAVLSELSRMEGCTIVYLHREGSPPAPTPLFASVPVCREELLAVLRTALYYSQQEQLLKRSRNGMAVLLSIITQVAVQIDEEGNILNMNPAAELFARCSAQKASGKAFSSLFRLHMGQHLIDNPAKLTRRQSCERFSIQGPDGDERTVLLRVSPCGQSCFEIPSCIVLLEDLTDSLLCTRDRDMTHQALQGVSEAVLILGHDNNGCAGEPLFCNKAFSELFSCPEQSISQRKLSDFFKPMPETPWGQLFDAIEASGEWKGEGLAMSLSGEEFSAQVHVRPIKSDTLGHCGYVIAVQDTTHIHRLEESIRQSQKIEAVGRLASGIAHDFNNLLSVINSYCDLQVLKLDEDSPAMRYAQQIRAAGRKGVDLVSQLMTFSRKDRPNPTQIDLSHVVEDVKSMLRRVIREDIEMDTVYGDDISSVKADQGQIEQILLNLCVNARDAMPNGGRLRIEVANRTYEKNVVRNHCTIRPGSYVVLSVEDSGCGMDEETQKRIFDPFFTTKEIGKGTGLGLATVQSIMKQYSGHIIVRSRPGEGSRFELVFPAESKSSTGGGLSSESSSGPCPTGSEKIFIVEDDETFLDCISGLLRLHGYQVYTAYDGSSALDMMAQIDYDIDMLVSDLVLPKLSGREVAARLLEHKPETKVIFMTGYDDQLDTFYSLPGDAIILEKPFPLNTLLIKARELLDQQPG